MFVVAGQSPPIIELGGRGKVWWTNTIPKGHEASGHGRGEPAGNKSLHAGLLCRVREDSFLDQEAADENVDAGELNGDVIRGAVNVEWRNLDTPLSQLEHLRLLQRSRSNQGRDILSQGRMRLARRMIAHKSEERMQIQLTNLTSVEASSPLRMELPVVPVAPAMATFMFGGSSGEAAT